eukprot:97758-Chlamydomonas_euryale.AAC.3
MRHAYSACGRWTLSCQVPRRCCYRVFMLEPRYARRRHPPLDRLSGSLASHDGNSRSSTDGLTAGGAVALAGALGGILRARPPSGRPAWCTHKVCARVPRVRKPAVNSRGKAIFRF